MSDLWFYADGNETSGPSTLSELVDALKRFQDPRKILVWSRGLPEWTKAEAVEEIAEKLFRPPPLPLTPPPLPSTKIIREPSVDASEVSQIKIAAAPLTGLGGWLMLVAFGQVIGVLKLLASLGKYYTDLDTRIIQQFPVAFYGEAAMNLVFFVLVCYTAMLFFKKSKSFPKFFIYELLAVIFLPLLNFAWVGITLSGATGKPFSQIVQIGTEEIGQLFAGMINAAIWISYVLKSRRVANTFTQ